MSLQSSSLQGSPIPRGPRRGKASHYSSPVSEVGMWKAKSNSVQNVLDDKMSALDHFRSEQLKAATVNYQHIFERSSSLGSVLMQVRSTIEGCLSALGPDRTHRMMECLQQVSSEVDELRECCQQLSISNDHEVVLLNDVLRTSTELKSCLKNRAEVGEQEYKKLVQSCEKQEALVARARTYIKVCIAERLAWQQDHGCNPARLPVHVDSFVARCRKTLESLTDIQSSSSLPSVAVLETANDSSRRFLRRAEETLSDGAVLLRYVTPRDELQLLEDALRNSGTDVTAQKELADRERRFERARDDVIRQSSTAIQSISSVKVALLDIREQLNRFKRDGFVIQLCSRIVNAVSAATVAPVVLQDASGGDSNVHGENLQRRETTVVPQRRSVTTQPTPGHSSPRSRGSRLLSNSVGAVASLVSPKRAQSIAFRTNTQNATASDVELANSGSLHNVPQPDVLDNSFGGQRFTANVVTSLSWKSPASASIAEEIQSMNPTPKSVSIQISPTSGIRTSFDAPSQVKYNSKARPQWEEQPFQSENEWPIPTTIQLVFDHVDNPKVRASLDNHRISSIIKRSSQTSLKVEEALKRVEALNNSTRNPAPPPRPLAPRTDHSDTLQKTSTVPNKYPITQTFRRSTSATSTK
ncbi:Hypothetical protein, putative [Bodo saltans]|uniref:Uncharacterized protein n=1 Tax=Bodo saltans TaxID=75058 RepID=A0A0S4JT54_BODSA|nr:Hypothetical protein, putative [Bodo saltans]|eukprot:CUG93413.1 Hypothetical protein, putative [Bodo saltans]